MGLEIEMSIGLSPFNPADPFDAAADRVRRKIASYGLVLLSDPDFKTLDTARQIECAAGGILTGLMGILHAFVEDTPEAHDEIERFVTNYVAQARAAAELIAASRETRN